MNKREARRKQQQSVSSKLCANIKITGVDVLKSLSADSTLEIETICTGKTSIAVNLFKS